MLSEGKHVPVLDYILSPVSNVNESSLAAPIIPFETMSETEKPAQLVSDKAPAKTRPIPFTAPWVVRRLKEDKLADALIALRVWTHEKRRIEANEETVVQIVALEEEDAIAAVQSLKGPKCYVRGRKGSQLNLPVVLQRSHPPYPTM